ncbi:MAG: TlpA disulfide reductase family protein [Capnocytophaga sp.]|nr:TlpA disulfide reductase family protein [Capnocytophaga sp.]
MKKIIVLLGIMSCTISFGQMRFSQRMKYSELASPKDKQLFFIDYWATWCGPCIHVASYLTTIQEQFPDELYILSLTQESVDVVRPFLEDHPTKLAVSLDYDGENFKKNTVRALPHGILFNADGKILWKGNPANITASQIRNFLRQNRKTIPIYDFITYSSYANETVEEVTFDGEYMLRPSEVPAATYPIVERHGELTVVQGSLPQIASYLLKVSQKQIQYRGDAATYTLYLKASSNTATAEKKLAAKILEENGYSVREKSEVGEVYDVNFPEKAARFWNDAQINWGEYNSKFLIADSQVSADDVSAFDFMYKLSELTGVPFRYKNSWGLDRTRHDWDVHYKFFDLMQSNLSDYGIEIIPNKASYPIYYIE